MPTLPTPTSRSLVLLHGDLKRAVVMFRQENDGKLYVSMDIADISELSDPGLLRCVHNTLHKPDLKGTYHNNLTNFLTKELLDIPQHDCATPALGFFFRELYALGLTTDVALESIRESMVLANAANQQIHTVFFVDGAAIRIKLLATPTLNTPSLVLHNDMPVDSQGDLLEIVAGSATEHFSLADFLYDPIRRSVTTPYLTNKLNNLYVGGGSIPALITSTQIRRTGAHTSEVTIPATGRVSTDEALKNIMNPPSTALQYRVSVGAASLFLEPLLNRKEVILQTDKDIQVGFSNDLTAAAQGFLFPAGAVMGFSLATGVNISFKAVADTASVFILQLGV